MVKISEDRIHKAEKCLADNGIDKDEAGTVLQALGYILMDTELYPESVSKRAYKAIRDMDDGADRLGFEILEQDTFDCDVNYYDIGRSVINIIENHPESFEVIEKVIIAITGYGFETLNQKVIEHKDYFDSL
ncbi:MAG: hypothetical protein J5929_01890 [Eubacterium sp.]|nr:hypothetical protein [Eubacterium sp.]